MTDLVPEQLPDFGGEAWSETADPTVVDVHRLCSMLAVTAKAAERLEARILKHVARSRRAGSGVADGFPSGGSSGSRGSSSSTSVEAAAFARNRDWSTDRDAAGVPVDPYDRDLEAMLDMLGQWAASKGAVENLLDRLDAVSVPPVPPHCEACGIVAGVRHPWDREVRLEVAAGVFERVRMCESARQFAKRAKRRPTSAEVEAHERDGAWRVHVDPKDPNSRRPA